MTGFPYFNRHLAEILDVPADAVPVCTELFTVRQVSKGEYLMHHGEFSDSLYFVEKGLLRMYTIDRNGREHIVQFAPEGWMVSDRGSLYFGEETIFNIDAIEDSVVLVMRSDFFTELTLHYPQAVSANELLLQKHIRQLQHRITLLLGATAEERYLDFIKTYPQLLQRAPQWMLASYLGVAPESLSRVRRELARKKFEIN
ncbi:MAG: Crp/Fnr family transcriptional regulator [Chryseobacterium sp.]|nr:MAG: Crp/Fnr family transcriptional regulator [Chryseobacterium sp.]